MDSTPKLQPIQVDSDFFRCGKCGQNMTARGNILACTNCGWEYDVVNKETVSEGVDPVRANLGQASPPTYPWESTLIAEGL